MKPLSLILAMLQALSPTAHSAEPIRFVAQIESEGLAEEAILLLHCLAARTNTSWEFSGEASGRHWLLVNEKKTGTLDGIYTREASTKNFALRVGDSEQACDKLEPGGAKRETSPTTALSPALTTIDEDEASTRPKPWLWLGLGAVAIAGFFYWKSKQPTFGGVEMR